jgi:hypothetical protein
MRGQPGLTVAASSSRSMDERPGIFWALASHPLVLAGGQVGDLAEQDLGDVVLLQSLVDRLAAGSGGSPLPRHMAPGGTRAGWRPRWTGMSRHASSNEKERTMYIGIGTVVVILAVIILIMLLRGRRV